MERNTLKRKCGKVKFGTLLPKVEKYVKNKLINILERYKANFHIRPTYNYRDIDYTEDDIIILIGNTTKDWVIREFIRKIEFEIEKEKHIGCIHIYNIQNKDLGKKIIVWVDIDETIENSIDLIRWKTLIENILKIKSCGKTERTIKTCKHNKINNKKFIKNRHIKRNKKDKRNIFPEPYYRYIDQECECFTKDTCDIYTMFKCEIKELLEEMKYNE